MRKAAKETVRVTDKIVQERIKLLEADPEFSDLWELLPKVLVGKESGVNFHVITTDREFVERTKEKKKVIVLSARDWDRYERFQRLCDKLAQKWGLHWATVENLAVGVEQPIVSPRLSRIITGDLDPVVFLPKDFNPDTKYVAHCTVAPPLEAIEIMRRVEELDKQVKEEIKAYLFSLFKDKRGCQIVELSKAESALKEPDDKVEFDVWLRVPTGYTPREVAEFYRKIDNRRRHVLTSLGISIPKRRRQSRLLMEAESLQLLEKNLGILGMIEDWFPDYDVSQDQIRAKAIVNKRYKGKKLIKKHLQQ